MIVETGFEQGSPEWHQARCGNPGATGVKQIITSSGKLSTQREAFLYRMAAESIEGSKTDGFKSEAMKRGSRLEPKAKSLFSLTQKVLVDECAMIYPDESKRWHISPDGIMPDREEGLEIKCPELKNHDKYLTKGVCPTEYRLQVQASMAVTGYKRWWFVSYFPGTKPLIIPVDRDEKLISIILEEMDRFISDLDAMIERLAA